MGPIENLCLSSWLYHGHAVTLYSYEKISAPKGVSVEDAGRIMSKDSIFKHKKNNSIAPFSDLFRILMMKNTNNIWLDTDVLLISPMLLNDPYVFDGYINVNDQNQIWANNNILVMKQKSLIIDGMLEYINNPCQILPLIHSKTKRLKLSMNEKLFGRWDLGGFPWGAFGTYILTDILRKNNLLNYVLVDDNRICQGAQELFEPIDNLLDVTERAMFAHFTTSRIESGKIKITEPEKGSLYNWAIDRYIK